MPGRLIRPKAVYVHYTLRVKAHSDADSLQWCRQECEPGITYHQASMNEKDVL